MAGPRIIIELDDEALAACEFTDENLPHAAAGFLERTIASELNRLGLPDGGHVTAIFFVPPDRAPAGGLSRWVRWGTNADGVYSLRPDDPPPPEFGVDTLATLPATQRADFDELIEREF